MSDQLALFRGPQARAGDPITSHVAAAAATSHAGERKQRILDAFRELGPLTDDELCEAFPAEHPPTIKSARSQLAKCGRLVPTGALRPSFRGSPMQVWRLPC